MVMEEIESQGQSGKKVSFSSGKLTIDGYKRTIQLPGWLVSYNQRALLVRMICNNKDYNITEASVKRVKYITDDTNSHIGDGYKCSDVDIYALHDFYAFISNYLAFEQTELGTFWREINECIDGLDFQYEKEVKEDENCWTSATCADAAVKLSRLSEEQRRYVSFFRAAFKCNMTDGIGKMWMERLVATLIDSAEELFGVCDIGYSSPSRHCKTNTVIEAISGDLDSPGIHLLYDSPYTSSKSTDLNTSSLSISSDRSFSVGSSAELNNDNAVEHRTVVPDFCVYLKGFPGVFPLVVELKPGNQEMKGLNQNLQQMLSKLFFQDVVFGMVISPKLYQLSVIIKDEGELHFASSQPMPLFTFKDNTRKLNIKNLNTMHSFIFQVLKWAKSTKCLLQNK